MSGEIAAEAARRGANQRQAMDRMYRLQRHIYDASRKYYLLGRDRLIDGLDVPEGGTVLEMGCGTGRNLIRVARRYPTAAVHGFDISTEMLKTAAAAISRTGLQGRIRLAQGDAVCFDGKGVFDRAGFDRVFFSYTLSMIPAWAEALEQAIRLTAAGGEIHVVDFGQCEGLPRVAGDALRRWLAFFHVTPRAGLAEVARCLAEKHGLGLTFVRAHRGYDWHVKIHRPR